MVENKEKQILVTRSSMPGLEEYVEEIKGLWGSHWLTNMGVKHGELTKKLIDYLKVDHVELMVNGHMALEMVLKALDLEGEVITTPFTFASTTHAIVRNNLTPVFCDIDPADYTMDVTKIEGLINEKTCAILPVHVYGNICNTEEIERIASNHGLKVIYDAAHTFGETCRGRGIASFGDASIFSFHATKVFNTIEGGAVCFKDDSLTGKLHDLRDFGIHGQESVLSVGANAKMNEFAAAMGICNLRHIDDEIAKRKKVFEKYMERLRDINGIRLPVIQKDVERNYGYFPVVFEKESFGKNRDEVHAALVKDNIFARKYFYPLTSEFECYAGKFRGNTPVAKNISENVLTLPIYADLKMETVDRICNIILEQR